MDDLNTCSQVVYQYYVDEPEIYTVAHWVREALQEGKRVKSALVTKIEEDVDAIIVDVSKYINSNLATEIIKVADIQYGAIAALLLAHPEIDRTVKREVERAKNVLKTPLYEDDE